METVVTEMAAASDVADARARTARILQEFSKFVQESATQESAKENAALKAHLATLAKDGTILKRAVALQNQALNAKTQELAAKEAELAAVSAAAEGLASRLKGAEAQNYALSVHLRQAADGAASASGMGGGGRGHDVF